MTEEKDQIPEYFIEKYQYTRRTLTPNYSQGVVVDKSLSMVLAPCNNKKCTNYPHENLICAQVCGSDCAFCPLFWENYQANHPSNKPLALDLDRGKVLIKIG